jgi:RHS repeat-associated protein
MKRASLAFGILLSSVVLIDCGSKMLGPDDLESQASAAVSAAGSIVPSQLAATGVSTDYTFGETPADFRVTESGQASYTVPLWTPEGPMNMAPSLAIRYESSGGSGPLGVGFSLTGNVISKIERCQKTIAIDNEAAPLDFSGTTYCLDGKRLMPRFAGSTEYRTREDDGSKIMRLGTTESNPAGWTVYARNGQVLTYGANTDGSTRLTGTLKPTSCVDNTCAEQTFGQTSSGTLAWMLEKVVDRVARISGAVTNEGNSIRIYYDKSFSSGTTQVPKYGTDFDFKEMLISRIEYGYGPSGTTPRRKVVFTYGADRSDARYTFVSGLPIQSTKLLTRIDMQGPDAATPPTTQVLKTYNFNYELGTVSSRSRLKRIFECDGGARPTCKYPNEFTWEDGTNNFLEIVDPTVRSMDVTSEISVVDHNADGKSDIVVRTPYNPTQFKAWYHFYSSQMAANTAQGVTTTTPVKHEIHAFQSEQEYNILGLSPLDIDGDSRSDFLIVASPNSPTTKQSDIWRNNGFVYDPLPDAVPPGLEYDNSMSVVMNPLFLDMDGDGLPEAIRVGKNQAIDNTVTPSKSYAQLLFQRNNAGTLGERFALTETAATFRSFTTMARPGYQDVGNGYWIPFEGHSEYGIDVDGSGRTALLIRDTFFNPAQSPPLHSASNMMRKVHLSRAGAVLSSLMPLAAARRGNIGFHYLWLDVNGDGLPDALDVPNSTTSAGTTAKATEEIATTGIRRIRINTGAGFKGFDGSFAANQGTKYAINAREDAGVQVADMNQDGEADIVLLGQAIRPTGIVDRTTVQVLVGSTGKVGSNHVVPALLPMKMTNGQEIPVAVPLNQGVPREGPMPAALGDFNGDGLADIVMARSTGTAGSVKFHFYIRQGTKADLLKAVDSGTRRHLGIQYAPVSEGTVYARTPTPGSGSNAPWEQPAECRHPHVCLTNNLWVVSRYEETNDQKVNVGHNMSYTEGRYWRDNWIGFAQRWDTDQTTGLIDVTTYDNRTAGVAEHYPFAFRPKQNIRLVRDNGLAPPIVKPHRFVTTNRYAEVANIFAPSAFSVRLTETTELEEILNDTPLHMPLSQFVFDNGYPTDRVANSTTTFTYDQFDNLKTRRRTNTMGEILETVYTPISDTNDWLMNRVSSMTETSTATSGNLVSRQHSYTYYTGTLLLNTETIQGGGSADVRSVITYTRGPGACGQVTQKTTTATSTADDTSVPAGTALTRTETTTYDTVDRVTVASKTNALNQTTLYAYHPGLGVLAQSEDPNKVITSYQYDTFRRIRKRTEPTAGEFTVSYEAPPAFPSQISSIVAALGPTFAEHSKQVGGEESIVTFNMNGQELVRQTKAGDGLYRYVLTRYTAVPRQVATVSTPMRSADTTLRLTTFSYDNLGRAIKTVHPGAAQQSYFYTPLFGPLGWKTTITDERGKLREEVRNDDGQMGSVKEYVGTTNAVTTYEYAPFGLLKRVNPPLVVSPGGTKPAPTSYTYDALGRRIQVIDADAGTTTSSYNAFGEVVKEVDALGTPTYFKRDALGRVRERSNTRDGVNTYVWDTAPRGTTGALAIGKIAGTTSFDGTTTTHRYDTYARPDVITWNIQGRSYPFKHNYDVTTGKVSQLDYPAAGTTGSTQLKVTYGYDSAGDISTVTRAGTTTPYWRATRWWADGKVDQESDGTGMVTTRVFDSNRRWLNSIRTAAGTTTIQNVAYLHDAAGNVFDRRDTDTAVNTSETFEYDDASRLKKWNFSSSAGSWTTDYQTHASGVIQQIKTGPNAATLNYDYFGSAADAMPHAARTVGGITRFHDAKGRFQSTFGGNSTAYTTFDLPKTIFDWNGNQLAAYQYDAVNNRVAKNQSGLTTVSIGGLYERSQSASGLVKHVMYIRGPGERVVAEETWTEVGTGVQASAVVYHHDDIVGSTVVTNSTATGSATRLRYDPFGLRINPTNPTQAPVSPPTRIGFTGHDMDDEFNLINMKGRIYDPKIARFLTPDPIVSAPYNGNGYDGYGYALNNPMKHTDPSGLMVPLSDQIMNSLGYDRGFIDGMRSFHRAVDDKIRDEWDDRQTAEKLGIAFENYVAAKAEAAEAMLASSKGHVGTGNNWPIHSRGMWSGNTTVAMHAGQVVVWTITNKGAVPIQFTLNPGSYAGRSQSSLLGPFGGTATFQWTVGGQEPIPWKFDVTMSNAFSVPGLPRAMPGFSVAYTLRSSWVPPDDKK